MRQLQLDLHPNPEALVLEDADGTAWVTGYNVPEKHGDAQGRVFFVAVIPQGEVPGRRKDAGVKDEVNAYSADEWSEDILGSVGLDPVSWNLVVRQFVDAHPAAVQGTTLEQALWDLIEKGKIEHDGSFRLRKVKKSAKRKPLTKAKKPTGKKKGSKKPPPRVAAPSMSNKAEVDVARKAIEGYRGQQPRGWVKGQLKRNGWSEDDAEALLARYYDKKKAKKPKAAKKPASKKKPKGKKPRRPDRSYDRPGVKQARTAACVIAAKRWDVNVKETCGASAPKASEAGRLLAERKWTSPADVASEWKAHADWARAANPKRWLNPNGLRKIDDPLLDLERYPWAMDNLVGAFRTDDGLEIFVWGDQLHCDSDYCELGAIEPFYVLVHAPKTAEVFLVEEGIEELAEHATVMEALGTGMRVAAEVEQAEWHPGYYPSFEHAMAAFVEKPRNRVEYVRLFFWNDPNGAYYSVLTMEPDEIAELFEQVFEDVNVREPRVETYAAIKARLMRE